MDTINLAREIDPDIVQFSKATPWKGTPLYDLIKDKGKFLESPKKAKSFNLYTSQFEIWEMNPEIMNKYFMLGYFLFYLRPRKIISFIK